MIQRYTRTEMARIWSSDYMYSIWFEIEAHVLDAQADLGLVPREVAQAVREKGKFDVNRIDEIETKVKHQVIAFLTDVAASVGKEARFLHQGMTSSDLLDTAFAVQLSQAADILLDDIDQLLIALQEQAFSHQYTLCMGRSHGVHAEPTTFGLKMAGHYAEFKRNRQRLVHARDEIATCAISGAVGTFATIDPKVEEYVARKMGLKIEPISSQIIPRDRHAMFFVTLGVIASSIERLAVEIRLLQQTELAEVEEHFSTDQKGSSAMPHKRNPMFCENLTGLARIVRSFVTPSLENVVLWHERDISHSSVERITAPDATSVLDFALVRLTHFIRTLRVFPSQMQKNLECTNGLFFSQRVLLALTQAGASRENAYLWVQRNASAVWENRNEHFIHRLVADPDIRSYLSEEELKSLCDLKYYSKYVDVIFQRVFAENS